MAEAIKEKKPNIFVRMGRGIKRFFKDYRSEMKKITWPTAKQTVKNTGVVAGCVLVVGAFIWIIDGALGLIISAILGI